MSIILQRSRSATWAGFIAIFLAMLSPAVAQYRLQNGDSLEISVAGMPDLRQRVTINVDGDISLPLFGRLRASGLKLLDVQEKIRSVATDKIYRMTGQDGRDTTVRVDLDRISVNIVEYRP